MAEVLVLGFRDLVTEPGGTILEHVRLLDQRGSVWWGWWMEQQEEPPRELFAQLFKTFDSGEEPSAYLLDTGRLLLYPCAIADMRVAPPSERIGPPDLESTPTYYHRGMYPAWFRLSHIDRNDLGTTPGEWVYAGFPSNPLRPEHAALVGQGVESLDQLRRTDATMWLINVTK